MEAKEIGTKLVELCRAGKNAEAARTLYADDVVSIEAAAPPGGERTTTGKEAVLGKGQWWEDNHEIHSAEIEGPFPHGDDRFAVIFRYDITNKPSKRRMQMNEVGIFTCDGGKVKREEFYYAMG